MNIFMAIEQISELNYFANSDEVIQIISEDSYYLIKCKTKKKKKKNQKHETGRTLLCHLVP